MVVAAVAVVWGTVGPVAPRGHAATPPPLAFVSHQETRPPNIALAEIADRAAASGVPAGEPGQTEYLKMRNWYLHSQVSEGTESEVIPEVTEVSRRHAPSARPPADAETLKGWLYRENPPDRVGPIKTYLAVTDLLRDRVLLPRERAAVLRIISGLPELRYEGETHDRAGRPGQAYSLDSDYSGLPTRYTLIVDPTNGVILANEQMLTTRAGELQVSIPSVIGYETYLRTEFRRQ